MPNTARFGVALIAAGGQAQSEQVHNEAIVRIAAMAAGIAEEFANDPPAEPAEDDVVIVGSGPATGVFAGRENTPAVYYGGAWRFIPDTDESTGVIPMGSEHEGLRFYVKSTGTDWRWDGYGWVDLG